MTLAHSDRVGGLIEFYRRLNPAYFNNRNRVCVGGSINIYWRLLVTLAFPTLGSGWRLKEKLSSIIPPLHLVVPSTREGLSIPCRINPNFSSIYQGGGWRFNRPYSILWRLAFDRFVYPKDSIRITTPAAKLIMAPIPPSIMRG